ncbi:MAG: dCTP deaminase [Gemmatimonadetes bacterium]|nr:dCTP deaminase [Gemmatimonadota bacterium]
MVGELEEHFRDELRVSDEFKIFTNVFTATVDPKAFDPRSFVDHQGDECVVPPNSFALARSVEYFRIPRNVLTVCLGKSTYARCFSADTRVALVDGSVPTLEEMAERAEEGEMFWGYAMSRYGRIEVELLEAPRWIGRDSLIEITLDNGERVRCTPDHEFLRRDGRMAQADDLRPGDSLMPLYRSDARGYEMVYQPLNGHLHPTHRLADEWNVRNGLYQNVTGTHRHHRDFNRRNNNPWNIERMEASEHIRLHNTDTFGEGFDPEAHGEAIRDALAARSRDPDWRQRYRRGQRERARSFWDESRYAEVRKRLLAKHRESWTDERRRAQSKALRAFYSDPSERIRRGRISRRTWSRDDGSRRARQAEIARAIRLREDIDHDAVWCALHMAGTIRGAARMLGCDRSVFRRFPGIVDAFKRQNRQPLNHKVESIRTLAGDHDVYCLTVPEAGNFALDAGVFVRNCGIIVNVTPLEPEWEGHVTLEISNTTPLPAKIYANEGLAQVLFFESDEACETSYKDRGGKYQAQRGVTLPKL